MGHGDMIDCGRILASRSFVLPIEHIDTKGFGCDQDGSITYLGEILG